jgi:glucokinase
MNITTFAVSVNVASSDPRVAVRASAIIATVGTFITVDIGGTHIRAALYKEDSTVPLAHKRIHTHVANQSPFDRMVGLIHSIYPSDGEVFSITVATPGPVDPSTGVVASTPNIRGWDNLPLGPMLEAEFHVPAHIGNDANLAALGEWRFGAARGHKHVLYLTISTGIGGGVIVDDQLLLGAHGLAAELGHVIIIPNGPICGCGHHGHLEAVAAGPAIARYVNERLSEGAQSSLRGLEEISAQKVAEAAVKGDSLAMEALSRSGDYIGLGLANYLAIFNPSIVVFGGGVSMSGELLFGPVRESLHRHVMDDAYMKDLTITRAALGDESGLLGALALAHKMQQRISA